MARTLTDMTNSVFIRLNESLNSPVGNLEYGSGNTAFQVTTATIRQYLDEGMTEVFKACLLLPGKGLAYTTAGVYLYTLNDLNAQMERTRSLANLYADGSTLWAARGVTYDNTALFYCGIEALALRTNNFQNVATGTPRYWYRDGMEAVGIWPAPATAAGLTAFGYVTPPSLALSATAVWMQDSEVDGVEFYAAIKIAEKAFDDPSLYGRIAHLKGDYLAYQQTLYQKISPTLAADVGMAPPATPTAPKRS